METLVEPVCPGWALKPGHTHTHRSQMIHISEINDTYLNKWYASYKDEKYVTWFILFKFKIKWQHIDDKI